MVARKAMISTGTARRSKGSAVSSRRYAGLAIDCARPFMESGCADALARLARAMKASVRKFPYPRIGRMCRIACRITQAIGIDGRRFVESPKSQLFKNRYPQIVKGGQGATGG